MSSTQPARGMRDFLPADVRKREYVIRIIKEVYEKYGFEPLETPAVENIETLMGKYGEEGNQLIFKILKRGEGAKTGEADLALRYDLTVPLARVVANYKNDLPKFFKRYQIQPVWRADRPARGRFREFYQCDVDAIGSKSMIVEAELISAVSEILERLGFEDFEIRLNHRKALTEMLTSAQIPAEKHTDALVSIDKLDKIGRAGVEKEFAERGIEASAAKTVLDLFDKVQTIREQDSNTNETILESLKDFVSDETLIELRQILSFAPTAPTIIDPSLARGLSYYTGAIFEIVLTGGDFAGSIGGGGRYDGLIGMFGKEQIPACGFSLGLERIIVVMNERGMFPVELETNSADVMITVWDRGDIENNIKTSLKLASELRAENLRVLVYPEADKLGKQFKYAGQIGAPFVCVLGDEELKENKVTLKNMISGEQETVPREELAAKIK